jgi:hypothetical protein
LFPLQIGTDDFAVRGFCPPIVVSTSPDVPILPVALALTRTRQVMRITDTSGLLENEISRSEDASD